MGVSSTFEIDLQDLRNDCPAIADLVEIFAFSILVGTDGNLTLPKNSSVKSKTGESFMDDGWDAFPSPNGLEVYG